MKIAGTVRRILVSLGVMTSLAFGTSMVLAPSAAAVDLFNNVCQGASGATACSESQGAANKISGPNGIIIKVTNLVARIAAVVAVIIILISGFMYVLSDGDSSKINNAKRTLIYTVVGIVVIIVSQTLIVFVISRL